MNTVLMIDENNNKVQAKVGDRVAGYDAISKRVVVGKIEGIKKGFKMAGMKVHPRPIDCIWLSGE